MTHLPPSPPRDADELAAAIAADGVEFLLVLFTNLHGKPCAKLTPVSTLDTLLAEGLGFAGHAAGGLGHAPSDPDLVAVPDVSSYSRVPLQPGLGIVHCDLYVEGEPWPYAPRWILQDRLAELAAAGRELKVGAEPEYFLLRRTENGGIEIADERDTSPSPCYDANAATRAFGHLSTLSRAIDDLGWRNYSNDHEDANGQFEHNFGYADALRTADRVIVFRYLAQLAAQREGKIATFMPKPFADLSGNGLHLHLSVWDSATGTSLFTDAADPRGLGMSTLGYHFIAGVLDHAPGLLALTCPTVNSYKRLGAGAHTRSGSSWAPGYASYGGNNRTHLVRVPDTGRIEVRGVDGAANPYLAIAGIAAAGAAGIAQGRDPGEPVAANLEADGAALGLRPLPPTLLHAVDELVADDVLRQGLGTVPGGEYVDYYARVKRAEFAEYHHQVTRWELDRYLGG